MPYSDPDRQRQYQRERNAARRRKWIAANGPCQICGSETELEVDHIDPSEKVSHTVWSWSEVKMLAELAKCQVLCQPCHVNKTMTYRLEKARSAPCGTESRYQLHRRDGEHCDICTVGHREYVRHWRSL